MSRFSAHIRQNAYGLVAVFIALTMGTAYATHPGGANTISSDDIIDGEIRSWDIRDNHVRTPNLQDGAVNRFKLAKGSVVRERINNGAVNADKLANGAVTMPKLADGAVTHEKLACAGNSPDDEMVRVGPVCIDRYENSIWDAPVGGNQITGAIPCDANGQDCTNIYARSVAGVTPRGSITWFQAQQALANSGKRLPTNAEWQMAVAGTPDSTDCNVDTFGVQNTGANAACVSNHGANDMVGNLWEWVADWDEQADGCSNWTDGSGETFSGGGDVTCFGDATPSRFPGALLRSGDFATGTQAGPFAVLGTLRPSNFNPSHGFRGAR